MSLRGALDVPQRCLRDLMGALVMPQMCLKDSLECFAGAWCLQGRLRGALEVPYRSDRHLRAAIEVTWRCLRGANAPPRHHRHTSKASLRHL